MRKSEPKKAGNVFSFANHYRRAHKDEWLAFDHLYHSRSVDDAAALLKAEKGGDEWQAIVDAHAADRLMRGATKQPPDSKETFVKSETAIETVDSPGVSLLHIQKPRHVPTTTQAASVVSLQKSTTTPVIVDSIGYNDLAWPNPLQPTRDPITGIIVDVEVRLSASVLPLLTLSLLTLSWNYLPQSLL